MNPLLDVTDSGERVTHLYPNTCYYAHLSLYYFAEKFCQQKIILDVGSGTGYGSAYLAEHGAQQVWAIDVSEKAILFSRQHFSRPNLHFELADAQSIPGFAPHFFDVIFTSNTLEHLESVDDFLCSAHRLLKPDGVLLIAVPAVVNQAARQANLSNPYHLNIWSPRQWQRSIQRFFGEVECVRHHAEKPGVVLNLLDTPDTAVLRPEDFLFLPISIEQLNEVGALTALYVARVPRALADLPSTEQPIEFVDQSFTRKAPSLHTDAKTTIVRSSLYQKFMVGLVLGFGLLATLYSVMTPGWEAPDEDGHFLYALHMRQTGSLPVQGQSRTLQAYHTPLYYMIVTLFSLPADLSQPTGTLIENPHFIHHSHGTDVNFALHKSDETFPYQNYALFLHLARLASVVMGMATVWFALKIGEEIFPQHLEIPVLAGLLIAFNPQFLFISGVIINDNLITLGVTGLLWQFIQAIKRPDYTHNWLFVGFWVVVATLAKVNGLLVIVLPALGLLLVAWKRRDFAHFWRNSLALGLPVILGTGWWFARNWLLYGEPLGWSKFLEVSKCCLRVDNVTWYDIGQFFFWQFKSFWAGFGWANVWAATWFYLAALALSLWGLIGLILFAIRRRTQLTIFQKQALISCGFLVVLIESYMLWAIRRFNAAWYQGRNIFPIIAPLMLLLATGIYTLTPSRYRKVSVGMIGGGLLLCALYMPFGVIAPAYPTIPLAKWQLLFLPYKTDYRFGTMFALRGYRVDIGERTVTLELYWQATQPPDFNYTAFVHLLGAHDEKIAQLDQVPGEAQQYAPTAWHTGDIIVDRHLLPVPNAQQMKSLKFSVGLYNWQTGQRLSIVQNGTPARDFVLLSLTPQ